MFIDDHLTFLSHFRCKELELFSRCTKLPSRHVTEKELRAVHSQEIIDLVKSTEMEMDQDKLENISSHYDSIYLHPVCFNPYCPN